MPTEEPLDPSDPFNSPTHQRLLVDRFAQATWVSLAFALVCLGLDVYAIFYLPHHHRALLGELHPNKGVFPYVVWTLEILLALLALWLIRFAFSRTPRLPPAVLATPQAR